MSLDIGDVFPSLNSSFSLASNRVGSKDTNGSVTRDAIKRVSMIFMIYEDTKLIIDKDIKLKFQEINDSFLVTFLEYIEYCKVYVNIHKSGLYQIRCRCHAFPYADKLIMQEVLYHILVGLLARLHQKKKEPWPTLPFHIRLYEIRNLKHADFKIEEFKNFTFNTTIFNPCDLHFFVKNHYARVKFPWINGVCH